MSVHAFAIQALRPMIAMPTRPYVRSRPALEARAQGLRRDPTPAEKKLWYNFLRTLPFKFTRQKPLGTYVVGFYCSACRLVVEIDGDTHYTETGQRYDASRTSYLAGLGLRVIRFTNAEVMQQFEGVCLRIKHMLRACRAEPPGPSGHPPCQGGNA
jgi:very-short-patch-repair endonuclease